MLHVKLVNRTPTEGKSTLHKARQYQQLANAPKADFFGLVAEGLTGLAEHIAALVTSAERCYENGDELAGDILVAIAREEAGKFLILLDATRIEWKEQASRSSQLKRASDHLAKSLYFEMSDLNPATLSEVERYFAHARKSHFLDGPNGCDWIFRNQSLAEREDAMYVDYQETDEGLVWRKPAARAGGWLRGQRVFDLVRALAASGFASEDGLKVVHELWSGFIPCNSEARDDGDLVVEPVDTHWSEIEQRNCHTIDHLRSSGIEVDPTSEAQIIDRWTFPLHGVDLSRIDTGKTIDEEKQRAERAELWDLAGYADLVAEQWENGPADSARDTLDAVASPDELDYEAELAEMKAEYINDERERFIDGSD